MMGLLTGYQDDAERVERKANQQIAVGNRRVDRLNTEAAGYNARSDAYNSQVGSYNKESESLKGLLAGPQKTIEDYNAQVTGFNNSAVRGVINGNAELWQISGWLHANPGYLRAVSQEYNEANGSKWAPAGAGLYNSSYSNGTGGGWYWADSSAATIRRATDGTPIAQMANGTPGTFYASWNDRPYVAPLTQAQVDAAKAADALLTSKKGQIDSLKARSAEIEEAGKKTKAEGDAIKAKGESITARNERVAKQSEREAARLESDVEMNKRRIAEEQQGAQQSGSVFDQNMAGVHQSISAWLNA